MHRVLKKPIALAGAAILVATAFAISTADAESPSKTRTPAAMPGSIHIGSLDGLNATVIWNTTLWYGAAVRADQERARVAAAAAARARVRTATATVGVTVTGDCAAMKPAGFPDAIIQRESGGNPTARNASGAYGCAQIMPQHYRPGGACAGMDYAACWSRLWAGGAGASNWACTRESGCG